LRLRKKKHSVLYLEIYPTETVVHFSDSQRYYKIAQFPHFDSVSDGIIIEPDIFAELLNKSLEDYDIGSRIGRLLVSPLSSKFFSSIEFTTYIRHTDTKVDHKEIDEVAQEARKESFRKNSLAYENIGLPFKFNQLISSGIYKIILDGYAATKLVGQKPYKVTLGHLFGYSTSLVVRSYENLLSNLNVSELIIVPPFSLNHTGKSFLFSYFFENFTLVFGFKDTIYLGCFPIDLGLQYLIKYDEEGRVDIQQTRIQFDFYLNYLELYTKEIFKETEFDRFYLNRNPVLEKLCHEDLYTVFGQQQQMRTYDKFNIEKILKENNE
jgi:hypothetical protein